MGWVLLAALLAIAFRGLLGHTFTFGITAGSGSISGLNVSPTGEQEINAEFTVAAGATDFAHAVAFAQDKIAGIFLYSDQDVTLETNSGSAPAQTFALKAGVPLVWCANMPVADPITTTVTGFYFTNAGAAAATVRYKILLDL